MRGQPLGRHPLQIGRFRLGIGSASRGADDQWHAARALPQQMPDQQRRGLAVMHVNPRQPLARRLADHDDRHTAPGQQVQERIVLRRLDQDGAIHHHVAQRRLGVGNRRHQHQRRIVLQRRNRRRGRNLHQEPKLGRPGRDRRRHRGHHGDGVRQPRPKLPCRQIGDIAQLGHRSLDPPPRLAVHRPRAGQGVGNGARRHASQPRHVLDRCPAGPKFVHVLPICRAPRRNFIQPAPEASSGALNRFTQLRFAVITSLNRFTRHK